MSAAPGPDAFRGVHVLVDDDPRWVRDPVAQARAACAGRPSVIQLRAKRESDQQVLTWAREIRALTRECGVRFIVNDRFDLALASEADGVHLGQEDLPPAALPEAVRASLAIGRSTHTLDQALAARTEPVTYVAFGPVFGTRSKDSPYASRGLSLLEEVARSVTPLPLVAIGGIAEENAAAVAKAGAQGLAVISAVAGAADPAAATRALACCLEPSRDPCSPESR